MAYFGMRVASFSPVNTPIRFTSFHTRTTLVIFGAGVITGGLLVSYSDRAWRQPRRPAVPMANERRPPSATAGGTAAAGPAADCHALTVEVFRRVEVPAVFVQLRGIFDSHFSVLTPAAPSRAIFLRRRSALATSISPE